MRLNEGFSKCAVLMAPSWAPPSGLWYIMTRRRSLCLACILLSAAKSARLCLEGLVACPDTLHALEVLGTVDQSALSVNASVDKIWII